MAVIDPVALATIASAVSELGNEYLKGIASDAGKATWTRVKTLLGWSSDPAPAEIPEKAARAMTDSPDLAEKLVALLKTTHVGTATTMVGKIEAHGGKVVVANTIITDRFQM
jgi:hypothetical protein